jgi:hypothetical protein
MVGAAKSSPLRRKNAMRVLLRVVANVDEGARFTDVCCTSSFLHPGVGIPVLEYASGPDEFSIGLNP